MAGCCDPRGCNDIFGPRYARQQARAYRKRGLDATARRMVGFLSERDIRGASVLEIGGGVGEIQLELLRRGATRATNLELVDAYEDQARRLASDAGMTGRIERRLVDIAASPAEVEAADVVVLHRVVCCYPDHERLLGAAADHARRLLVYSHPPRNALSLAVLATENAFFRLAGKTFRGFSHSPEAMLAVLHQRGLRSAYSHHGMLWEVAGLERAVS